MTVEELLVGDVTDPLQAATLRARLAQRAGAVHRALVGVYGEPEASMLLRRGVQTVVDALSGRPLALQALDREREIDPGWFQSSEMVGYVAYADRFAGDLRGLHDRLDHLADLGVTYLHLMPLLHARPAPNDGGYAVIDYGEVDPSLGSMDDLARLADDLRDRGISLCVDVVMNHTAREHRWADKARGGDPRYLAYYRTFGDRSLPDAYEATLPQVFPDFAPGNFTYDEDLERWVWTTFNSWQWDLDWSNPDVFVEMLQVILDLANVGVDVVRLDAVPFLWKRLGTDCQNQPEAHLLLQALRGLVAIAAPSVIFKGEAIVAPDDLVVYQGAGRRLAQECDLAYHNQLMVQGWSSVAAQDGRLAALALERMQPTPSHASWVTYVRCHDDIGWAVHDIDAARRGWHGAGHRRFLSSFYAGDFPGSFARGAHFQEDFVSGDRRTSGGTAALCGIADARARGDDVALDLAIRRLLLLYALAASYGGIPAIYMGDELALADDVSFRSEPARAEDNRWLHRPRMDEAALARRHQAGSVEQRVFDGLAHIMSTRKRTPTLGGGGQVQIHHHDNDHVLAFQRRHPWHGRMIGLANFSEGTQTVQADAIGLADLIDPFDALASDRVIRTAGGRVVLSGLSMCWLTEPAELQPSARGVGA